MVTLISLEVAAEVLQQAMSRLNGDLLFLALVLADLTLVVGLRLQCRRQFHRPDHQPFQIAAVVERVGEQLTIVLRRMQPVEMAALDW